MIKFSQITKFPQLTLLEPLFYNRMSGNHGDRVSGDEYFFSPVLCEKSRVVKRSLCRVSRARSTGSEACTEQIQD